MDEWLENLFEEIIWQALVDLYNDIATWAEGEIETALKGMKDKVGEKLASSPVVSVLAYDTAADTVTFFIRGRVPLFEGVESVFMRVEVTISTDVDLTSGGRPITITQWHTLVGDLKISKKNVFEANLAIGYDKGVWLGRGTMKVLPAGFGLDLFLGGLSDRGMMIGLDIDLPAPIPLGTTGLGLSGMGGDFAYNFVARLESAGVPLPDPNAKDYVAWARNTEVDRWKPGPIEETAVGVGIRTDLITLADNGYVIKLEPIGLAVLTPGPVFILGGVGKLVSTDSARIEGYLAVDIGSASLALGMGVHIKIPKSGDAILVDATGTLDAFFSFANPSLWYVNLGSEASPIKAKILSDLYRAELYFMINNDRFAFGAGLSIGGEWKWWIIKLVARLGANVAAKVGWNPVELEGMFAIWGELGFKVWKFGFLLKGTAKAVGHTPRPHQLKFSLSYKLDLPWPLSDIEGEKSVLIGDETPSPPSVSAPLQAGQALTSGAATQGVMSLAALHALTGRQWALDEDACWPDAEIVVPFSARATDLTGAVVGSPVTPTMEGGYEVEHELKELQVWDISGGGETPISNLQAVWAAGPGGDTARLHVLGQDPFSWVVPHPGANGSASETPPQTIEQHFGFGPATTFDGERRFGMMVVEPLGDTAQLVTVYQPTLPTRVLIARDFALHFRTLGGKAIPVDHVTLLVLSGREWHSQFDVPNGKVTFNIPLTQVYGDMWLWALGIDLAHPEEIVELVGMDRPIAVYAVRYRKAKQTTCNHQPKPVLKPGKYRIRVAGESKAEYPGGALPDSPTTTWEVVETFDVTYPETLRPYIHETTLGDSRLFFDEKLPWNPSMYGFGFPAYQQYHGVIRFLVPYLSKIFPTLRVRLAYESGTTLENILTPQANAGGTSFLLKQSQMWIHENCGTVEADELVALTSGYPEAGPARLFVYFDHPSKGEVKLDEWSCYVSRFNSFADHLAWPGMCLTVFYGPTGRTERPCCPALPPSTPTGRFRRYNVGNRIDPVIVNPTPERFRFHVSDIVGPLLEVAYPLPDDTYPDELSTPPATWQLPATMNAQIQPLNPDSGHQFASFARLSGDRFNGHTGDVLDGINDTVGETTIEAVTDAQGRLFCLWLRTPEPVDWRRVSAKLRIRHVEQSGDCPTAYAKRHPLDLAVRILPSPDGSSAFLVGELAGVRTRLPRGEYTLDLTFDPKLANLPTLSPSPAVTTTTESVTVKFIQPSGDAWPLPQTGIHIPAGLLDELIKIYHVRPELIDELLKPKPDPRVIERWRRVPPPEAVPPVEPETFLSGPTAADLLNRLETLSAETGSRLSDLLKRLDTIATERPGQPPPKPHTPDRPEADADEGKHRR